MSFSLMLGSYVISFELLYSGCRKKVENDGEKQIQITKR